MKRKSLLVGIIWTINLCGCSKQMLGPCYQAMQYRQDAKKVTGVEQASLLGQADAAQRNCDEEGKRNQERQKKDAMTY